MICKNNLKTSSFFLGTLTVADRRRSNVVKGQLISKYSYGVFKLSKKHEIFKSISALAS